jgi:fimbrial chaperone protein
MRILFLFAALAAPIPVFADAANTMFDVAPTTLDLKAGEAGLFFVTNHGTRPVTIQIEALDWRQADGADQLSPSDSFFTSPPLARLQPGARQSIRVLARPTGRGEAAYRLRVSELPDPNIESTGIRVLMQFLVPVFVDHQNTAPKLAWAAREENGRRVVTARNMGQDAVKLDGLALNGAAVPAGLVYILPGASRSFSAATGVTHVSGRDARSGRAVAFDLP